MGFLQRLFGTNKQESAPGDPHGYYVYAQCDRCKALIRARIDMRNDLSEDDQGQLIVRKNLVDDRCFRPIEVVMAFGRDRRPQSQEITGGRLISAEEHQQLRDTPSAAQEG